MPIRRAGKSGPEQRRVDRAEGQKLVFAGAQDYARRAGKIREGRNACYEQSVIGRGGYTLRTNDGSLIMRVPLVQAREMLRFRRALARKLLSGMKEDVLKESSLDVKGARSACSPSTCGPWPGRSARGGAFPTKKGCASKQLISLGLLCCCLVPGVIYYLRRVRAPHKEYQEDLKQLVQRWRMQGKPDPPHSFFLLYDL